MTALEPGSATACQETALAVAKLWEAHLADTDASKAAADLRVREEAEAVARAHTALTAALALADALPCPVAWCTADHTTNAYRFTNDAYVALWRVHVATIGGFKLDTFENVSTDGSRVIEPPMLIPPASWEGMSGALVDDITDAITTLQAFAATLTAGSTSGAGQ